MKIRLDIDSQYKEREILIKSPDINNGIKEIIALIDKNTTMEHITGYKDGRFSIFKTDKIFRIFS